MSNHVYKIIQLAGSSSTGIEDAIETAIAKAAKTVRNVDWFEVTETRGQIKDGKVAHYQVILT
jgi:flavin-binding protein dodecin